MIWSDPEIQKATRHFVCATSNCFYLNPPNYIQNLPDPKGTDIFKRYIKEAPRRTWPRAHGSHQGVYVMTPEGGYLYGKFVSVTKTTTDEVMRQGWQAWSRKNRQPSQPVPRNHIRPVVGKEQSAENLKIRVTYRDLPRGKTLRPGTHSFPNPYNLQWHDLSASDLHSIVFKKDQSAWKNLIIKTMKDSVRGEMSGFQHSDWRSGDFNIHYTGEEGPYLLFRINARFELRNSRRSVSYKANVYGTAVYDRRTKEFSEFRVLAAGDRSGSGPSNGRGSDRGSAPMAVAIRINY